MLYFFFFNLRYILSLPASLVIILTPLSAEWFHLVLNYLGPDPDHGVDIYQYGEDLMIDDNIVPNTSPSGTGVVVIGKSSPKADRGYSSIMVDEVMFFNRKLTMDEIGILYNMHN